jgi:glycosyltransferase involved in cell wall biosynthesis
MAKPIVFVIGSNPVEALGGGASYARLHARAALRIGFEPHIFCPAPQAGLLTTDFGVVHLVASPFRPFGALMSACHSLLLARSIERFFSTRAGPHLIHCFIWWRAGVIASQRLRRKGVEALTLSGLFTTANHEISAKLRGLNSAHGASQRCRYLAEALWTKTIIELEERHVYRESHLLTYNYDSVRKLFLDRHGKGVEMRKLPYTSEAAFLRETQAESTKPVAPHPLAALKQPAAPLIVAVSRHDPRKGLDVLLHALAHLRATGVEFRACLVGGGPLLESHRRLAQRLQLEDVTAIVGWVPDPFVYLQHADIFVLPSIQEGSGSLSLIEALQAGLPVVASNLDGIPEDVTDGESALLVEPGQAVALSQALAQLINDAGLRQRLACRAREVFVEKFSPAVFTEALRATYAELGFTP